MWKSKISGSLVTGSGSKMLPFFPCGHKNTSDRATVKIVWTAKLGGVVGIGDASTIRMDRTLHLAFKHALAN